MKPLQEKVALVTGATSGIGRSTAVALAEAGARLVLTGRRPAEGEATAELVREAESEAAFVAGDITDESHVATAVKTALDRFGRLDIAVNNAGVEITGAVVDANHDDYRRIFDINVWGVLCSMKHEIPAMIASGGGSIVNLSSIAGHVGMPGAGIYIASKHAVEGLTKTTALEYAERGIRVNAVAPGLIDTDMATRFAGDPGADQRDQITAMHPLGRSGRPEEIAHPIVFLASDAASFITGHSLAIDGGWLAR